MGPLPADEVAVASFACPLRPGDTAAALAALRRNGVVRLAGFAASETAAALVARADFVRGMTGLALARREWSNVDQDHIIFEPHVFCDFTDLERFRSTPDPAFFDACLRSGKEYLDRLLVDCCMRADFLGLATDFLGSPAFSLAAGLHRQVGAGAGAGEVALHQDARYVPHQAFLVVWLALESVAGQSSGVLFSRRRVTTMLDDVEIAEMSRRAAADDATFIAPPMSTGDALVFDRHCLHGTYQRRHHSHRRVSVDFRIVAA